MNIQQPLICICIPNYNNAGTISETLASLLNQTYKNILIKIFDNASTDNSMMILKDYQAKYSNIHVFQNETNIGGEANFTKCIENMEGEFSAIYHADDLYSPTMIEEQVRFLQSYSECSAVATHALTIDRESQIKGERFLPDELRNTDEYIFENQYELFHMILKYGNIITCPSVMARTDIYKNKIQQWYGSDFKTSADLDVWLRLAGFGKFGFITKPLIHYRVSEASYSYNLARIRTEPHDLFLVLDTYMDKDKIANALTTQDWDYYWFLVFKDHVNRSINMIIQGKKPALFIQIFSIKIIKCLFQSKEHLKIYSIGVATILFRFFSKNYRIQKLLYRLRFGG